MKAVPAGIAAMHDAWDTHAANFAPLRNLHCPIFDRGISALLEDMSQRGMFKETLLVTVGEFGRSPHLGVSTSGNTNSPDGRDHWPYCYTAMIAGAGMHVGRFYGASDQTASSPKEKPVYPNDLLATVYYSLGIDPDMVVLNHLNQPRELVKGKQIADLVVAFPIPTVVAQFNRAKNRLGRNPIRPDVFRASKRLRQHGAIGQLFRIALPVFVQCAAAAPKHWQWHPSHF